MTPSLQRLAGRLAVAALLVLLAAGTVLATAATRPTAPVRTFAEPSETAKAEATESPEASESPEANEPPEANETPKAKESPDAEEPSESPDADEDTETQAADASPSPANLARIVERLADAGITTTADQLATLAAKVGVGGAVRVLRFADASGTSVDAILAMRDAGKGWGVIARELKLDINPGNGSVMGKGHGPDKAAKAAAKAARAAERAQRKAGSGD